MSFTLGYENAILTNSTVTARNENDSYPVSNMTRGKLFPAYRSEDKALSLNGSDEYATHVDNADFDIASNLTIEFSVYFTAFTTGRFIVNKVDGTTGYGIQTLISAGNKIRAFIGSTANYSLCDFIFSTATWYLVKMEYNAVGQTVTWHIDRTLETAVVTGAIPASIPTNALDIFIASAQSGASPNNIDIGFMTISPTTSSGDKSLDPTGSAASWEMNQGLVGGLIPDGSGNGNDLTVVNIDSTNFIDYTFQQWITFTAISGTVFGDIFIIDRHHNLSTGAEVSLWSGDKYVGPTFEEDNVTVTAGEPIVLDGFSAGETEFWLEIDDPSNTDGYISIPLSFFGDFTVFNPTPAVDVSMTFDTQLSDTARSDQVRMQTRETEAGARTGMQTSVDEIWEFSGTVIPGTDAQGSGQDIFFQAILETIIKAGKRGVVPIVCRDDDTGTWRNVYITQDRNNNLAGSNTYFEYPDLRIVEVGGGI